MASDDATHRGAAQPRPWWQVWVVALSAGLALGACASTAPPQPTSTQRPQPTSTKPSAAPIPLSVSVNSSANLLTNSSFEQPVMTNESPPSPLMPGWAMAGMTELVRVNRNDDPYGLPVAGSQYLVLTGTVRDPGKISQRVHTVPGDTYRLTFLQGTNPDCGGAPYVVDAYWNGVQVLALSSTPVPPSKTHSKSSVEGWYTESDAFLVATTSITTMTFAGGVGCGAAFDDVVLQQAPPTP